MAQRPSSVEASIGGRALALRSPQEESLVDLSRAPAGSHRSSLKTSSSQQERPGGSQLFFRAHLTTHLNHSHISCDLDADARTYLQILPANLQFPGDAPPHESSAASSDK